MAQLLNQNPNQGWVGDSNTRDVLNGNVNSQNSGSNTSNVTIWISVYHTGGYTETGPFNGQAWRDGTLILNNTTGSITIGSGEVTIASVTLNISHDVNGNANPYIEYYVNQPATSMSRRGTNWALPRIALAPTISSTTSSAITPVTATIASAVSSNGNGTSTTLTYFYRVSGGGAYTNAGTGSSRNLTGLTPNTLYQWYVTAANNNGDTATSSIQTFTTLSGVKMITSGGGTVDRVVKQILPSGVTTIRIVTKIT